MKKYYKLPVQTKVSWYFFKLVPLGCREFGTYSVLAEGHLYSKSTGHLRKCARTGQPNYNYCHLPLSARHSYGAIRLLLRPHATLSGVLLRRSWTITTANFLCQRGAHTAQLDYNYGHLPLSCSGEFVRRSWTITTAACSLSAGHYYSVVGLLLLPFRPEGGALVLCSWTITTATCPSKRGARTMQLDYNYCCLPLYLRPLAPLSGV